jgi:hypothetical protein
MPQKNNLIARFTMIVYLFLLSCSSSKQATTGSQVLPASSLQPFGRYAFNEQGLELISTAVHFGSSFSGTECRIFTHLSNTTGHNYLQYELDGVYQRRIRIDGNAKSIVIIAPNGGNIRYGSTKLRKHKPAPYLLKK